MGYLSILFKNTLFILMLFSWTSASAKQTILVWGDSLSAAYGIPVEKGWVNLMRQKLGKDFEIINGSISGETTQGGLTRFPKALTQYKPDLVILELGANDGLRGIPPMVSRSNLKNIIEASQKTNAKLLLLGMKIPPNYGVAYSQKFEAIFVELADKYQLPFIPFFMEDIIDKLELFQEDELHPTAEAQPILLEKVLIVLEHALALKKPLIKS